MIYSKTFQNNSSVEPQLDLEAKVPASLGISTKSTEGSVDFGKSVIDFVEGFLRDLPGYVNLLIVNNDH